MQNNKKPSSWSKPDHCTPQEWKKLRAEKKAQKRKWKEEKLMKELQKTQAKEVDEAVKRSKNEEDEKLVSHGRNYTMSIALPGSILDNAQSAELKTYLAGQIARAAVVFNVDEIIIFDESGDKTSTTAGDIQSLSRRGNSGVQMARILQYLECPQYLRKAFFPQHKDLQYAGLLNPLACPHHLAADDDSPYREGVVVDKPVKEGKGSFVNVGLLKEVQIDKKIQPGIRVTVQMPENVDIDKKRKQGIVVGPSVPREHRGLYWGYTVRLATSLGRVFTESPYDKEGYDLLLGTSDRGDSVDDLQIGEFKHMLVVFGGVQGLEASLDADEDLHIDDPSLLFTRYLNTCPDQGSRTIRTEEAILITLAALRPKVQQAKK